MRKRKSRTTLNILKKHFKYERWQRKAYFELLVLEEHFSRRHADPVKIISEIQKHIESYQKETSYFGYKSIRMFLIALFVIYLLTVLFMNREFTSEWIGSTSSLNLLPYIFTLISLFFYLFTTISDFNKRKRLYINQYMLKMLDERIFLLKNKAKTSL